MYWSISFPISSAPPRSNASSDRPGRADRNTGPTRPPHTRLNPKAFVMNGEERVENDRRIGRGASFRLLVTANVLMMAAASAPSPVYPLYLRRWGFSVTVLTVVFAVYVAGLLGALLTAGSLSDHLGRRPVLIASLLVAAVGTVIFWTAGGVGALILARVVQGIATGTATGALAAGLVEFSPIRRPNLGPTMTAV